MLFKNKYLFLSLTCLANFLYGMEKELGSYIQKMQLKIQKLEMMIEELKKEHKEAQLIQQESQKALQDLVCKVRIEKFCSFFEFSALNAQNTQKPAYPTLCSVPKDDPEILMAIERNHKTVKPESKKEESKSSQRSCLRKSDSDPDYYYLDMLATQIIEKAISNNELENSANPL